MNESYLKKEINDAELQRVRNLITKQFTNSTQIQGGYVKKEIPRNEGDVWVENGKKYTIKNGVKVNISSTDDVRASLIVPLFCPKCSSIMKHDNDKKMYNIYGHCFSCQIKEETDMKINGTYSDFEKNKLTKNIISIADEIEEELIDMAHNPISSYVTEAGDSENWIGDTDNTDFIESVKEIAKKLRNVKL